MTDLEAERPGAQSASLLGQCQLPAVTPTARGPGDSGVPRRDVCLPCPLQSTGTWQGSLGAEVGDVAQLHPFARGFLGSGLAGRCLWPRPTGTGSGFYLDVSAEQLWAQACVGVSWIGFHRHFCPELPGHYHQHMLCWSGWSLAASFETGVLSPTPTPFFSREISSCRGPKPTLWGHSPTPDPPAQKGA